ncbi:MAG TPA: D-alanine--D-alanine ligase [Polyangiaceae bacterium]|nr:D-alanine--D-alanine ligase [Polyangiaceae bacterium]
MRLSVAVVQGGPSTEAEVSRASARGVAAALEEAGHQVVRLELDAFLAESLRTGGYDVVFPVTHGAVGEDGCLQGLLEVLGLPYVGSDVLASALAMHKRVARVLFERDGLPVARGLSLARGESDARAAAERARRDVGVRLVIKPSAHGSAIGVARIEADAPLEDVARAIEAVWAIDEHAIVEHFARGREVTCGVLHLHLERPQALPPTEILSPRDPFYTYEARYAPGRSVHVCPAKLPPAVTTRVQQVAERAHAALGCRDLSRVDFVVGDEGDPEAVTLLEVNTLPGMTATSLYPEAAAAHGLPMPRLCDALATRAHTRGPTQRMAPRPLPH